jgi:hypothetical protein
LKRRANAKASIKREPGSVKASASGQKGRSRGQKAYLERNEQQQSGNASNGGWESELCSHHDKHTDNFQRSCPYVHVVRPNIIKSTHIIAD